MGSGQVVSQQSPPTRPFSFRPRWAPGPRGRSDHVELRPTPHSTSRAHPRVDQGTGTDDGMFRRAAASKIVSPAPEEQSARWSLRSVSPSTGTSSGADCRGGHSPQGATAGGARPDTPYRGRCDMCDLPTLPVSDAVGSTVTPVRAIAPPDQPTIEDGSDKTGENECGECSPPSGWLD